MNAPSFEPTFDADDGRYHLECSWDGRDQPGLVVIQAVADVLGRDPLDLEPLQATVDVDALTKLLTRHETPSLLVTFEYADATVTIDRSGSVTIDPD
ncbi:hypothetical protein G9C85_16085 [Halorubellus sp. JP-L1]|uniref:HalOD1 output domain-containing protein n=1 Tax=Halorubellus sp. JP-L1 TaxID=2715753 RepID=UPI00140AC0CE|nr:HalOD1 output domain-containing protein [Halorubellus sp. JP-L1]NHN43138.1 hypothetical protein [Halorubellus sp. JP-L1]